MSASVEFLKMENDSKNEILSVCSLRTGEVFRTFPHDGSKVSDLIEYVNKLLEDNQDLVKVVIALDLFKTNQSGPTEPRTEYENEGESLRVSKVEVEQYQSKEDPETTIVAAIAYYLYSDAALEAKAVESSEKEKKKKKKDKEKKKKHVEPQEPGPRKINGPTFGTNLRLVRLLNMVTQFQAMSRVEQMNMEFMRKTPKPKSSYGY